MSMESFVAETLDLPLNSKKPEGLGDKFKKMMDGILDKFTKPEPKPVELPVMPKTRESLAELVNRSIPNPDDKSQDYLKSMKFLAKGGENLVLTFEEGTKHQDTVYKINYREAITNYMLLEDDIKGSRERSKEMITLVPSKIAKAREYFGKDTVPAQKLMVRDLPVDQEVVSRLAPSLHGSDLPEKLPMIVTVQRKLDLSGGVVSLNGFYPERYFSDGKRSDLETYKLAYGYMLDDMEGEPGGACMDWVILDQYPRLKETLEMMYGLPRFRSALRDAVAKMVRFSNETGILLELAGRDNIAMVREGSVLDMDHEVDWKFIMPDAFTPTLDMTLDDLSKNCDRLAKGEKLGLLQLEEAVNELNSVRYVNFLARLVGLSERIQVPALRNVPADKWVDLFMPKKQAKAA